MITTPIYNFVRDFKGQNKSRFFMPGHKGCHPYDAALSQISQYDITEIKGADALFEASGIIGESENNAAQIFGSKATLYSTQGSTLGIQTMLSLLAQRGDTIIAGRNAHMAFCNACALLRLKVYWILPESSDPYGVRGTITVPQIERALEECPEAVGVYLTSPDYLGNTVDIEQIAHICHQHDKLLCCDNAHGAYFITGPKKMHPIHLGADLCCDSAHKTLPVFTGGAYLHLGKQCPWDKEEAKQKMAMFSSTSPSYLTLISLDLCNRYLSEQGINDFNLLYQRVDTLKRHWKKRGVALLDTPVDFAKITLDAAACGWDGEELADYLRECQIECEYANSCYVVLMTSPFLLEEDFKRLKQAVGQLPLFPKKEWDIVPFTLPEQVLPIFEAMGKEWERIPLDQAVGRVSAQTIAACPPGVPVVVAGERIYKEIKNIYKNSGNFAVKVIK